MQEYVHFFYFADIPCFFSQGRDQLLESAGQRNIGPISALYMAFGPQGWRALINFVDMVLAKSLVPRALQVCTIR